MVPLPPFSLSEFVCASDDSLGLAFIMLSELGTTSGDMPRGDEVFESSLTPLSERRGGDGLVVPLSGLSMVLELGLDAEALGPFSSSCAVSSESDRSDEGAFRSTETPILYVIQLPQLSGSQLCLPAWDHPAKTYT